MKLPKCQVKGKMRQEKAKEEGGKNLVKRKSQDYCGSFEPKTYLEICFLCMSRLWKLTYYI